MSDERISGRVKVRFRLVRDDDGWLPAESEGLWAVPLGSDEYRIDNVPWFVRKPLDERCGVCARGQRWLLWAIERRRASGHITIRVIPRRDGPLHGDSHAVLDHVASFGVTGEGIKQYGLVALDVPPGAD